MGPITAARWSTDPLAGAIRDTVDFTKQVTMEEAKVDSAGRPIRVLALGVFDLFHFGHSQMLQQAKTAFPRVYLIAGAINDDITHDKKGPTVMTDVERYNALRHCRYVDEVCPNSPLIIDEDFIQRHKIDFVAHDDAPYVVPAGNGNEPVAPKVDIFDYVKEQKRFVATERTEGVSTSDLIARIIQRSSDFGRMMQGEI